MISLAIADELLILVAATLLLAEIYAVWMVRRTRQLLNGGVGDYLLRVVFRFGVVVTIAQGLTLANAVLRYVEVSNDARLLLFLAIESLLAIAFLWTVWEIHHLPADRYLHYSARSRSEPVECVCEEIDDTIPSTGTPVD